MKIIGWTAFNSECQGICAEDKEVLLEALNETVRTIRENKYLFSGETHQQSPCCVPVFDNGKCLKSSMRAWAMLMSMAHTGSDKAYMNYYMAQFIPEKKLPAGEADPKNFVIDKNAKGFPYYYCNQDLQLVAEAVALDMQLATFDKVVIKLFNALKKAKEE